jgi:hypothetical protein
MSGVAILRTDRMRNSRSRTPEPPYCWQSKDALRRIREYMQGRDQWQKVSSRLCLYLALCEMASNRGNESFRVSQKALADLCGLSDRTQREILLDLQGAGVITASAPKDGGQGQKTYTLLSFDSEGISGRTEATSERSEMSVNMPSLPTLEVTIEEQEKNNSSNGSRNRPSRKPSSRIQLVDHEHILGLKQIYQSRDVDKALADCKAWLLTPKGKGKALSKRRVQTFLRDAEPLPPEQTSTSARGIEIDRSAIDPDEFKSYLASEYPAGFRQGWTPEKASEGVVRNFLNDRKAAA